MKLCLKCAMSSTKFNSAEDTESPVDCEIYGIISPKDGYCKHFVDQSQAEQAFSIDDQSIDDDQKVFLKTKSKKDKTTKLDLFNNDIPASSVLQGKIDELKKLQDDVTSKMNELQHLREVEIQLNKILNPIFDHIKESNKQEDPIYFSNITKSDIETYYESNKREGFELKDINLILAVISNF